MRSVSPTGCSPFGFNQPQAILPKNHTALNLD
jgi:hypothetical protein